MENKNSTDVKQINVYIGKDGKEYSTYEEMLAADEVYNKNMLTKNNEEKENSYYLKKT